MKYIILALGFALSACTMISPKKTPEVVASCFSDGEDQEKICKSQRTNEENKIVITRCIGSQNREANPALRGKCVEKTCSEGSNTDCVVKGEMRVLEQYSELVTSNLFGDGESAGASKKISARSKKMNRHKAAVKAQPSEVETDPSIALVPLPEKKPVVEATPTPVPQKVLEAEANPTISIALKPAKSVKKSNRTPASAKIEEGFKKVCVSKNDFGAPELLRGKCATRSCSGGKCQYQGRKEMFDYAARVAEEIE